MPVLRRGFHDDAVLVERVVNGRDLALAESIVQRGIDHARRDAEARGGVAVDDERRLQPAVLLIGADVGDLGQTRERLPDWRLPSPQVFELVRLQRELVLRLALASADADVLHRLQEQVRAGLALELPAQPRDDLIGGDLRAP